MKVLRVLALFCCFAAGAQEGSKIVFRDIDSVRFYERIMIEAGARVPMGSLADKVGVSPEFGLWFRSRMRNYDMVDIGFSVHIPAETKGFDYNDRGHDYKVDPAGVSGMAGIRINKVYTLGGVRYRKSAEWISSFGYAFFMYRDKYPDPSIPDEFGNQDVNFAKALSTFHLGQGARLNIDNMGFQINYSYTPYGQFSNHVGKDFGAHSLTFGVVYRQ